MLGSAKEMNDSLIKKFKANSKKKKVNLAQKRKLLNNMRLW